MSCFHEILFFRIFHYKFINNRKITSIHCTIEVYMCFFESSQHDAGSTRFSVLSRFSPENNHFFLLLPDYTKKESIFHQNKKTVFCGFLILSFCSPLYNNTKHKFYIYDCVHLLFLVFFEIFFSFFFNLWN